MQLLQTSTDHEHYHMVVLDDQGGGSTTLSNNHVHPVTIDPVSGQPVLGPGPDGHIHALVPVAVKPVGVNVSLSRTQEADLVSEVKRLRKKAKEFECDFRKLGKESIEFSRGQMWTKAELDDLETNERAPSVINEIEAKMDLLSGYQRQNRYDLKYYPMENGDVKVADILTILWKHDTSRNFYEHRESAVFWDGIHTGRGVFQMRIDRDDDIQGKIVIEQFPWDGAYFGPHLQADLSDLEYLTKETWYSVGKIKQLWPKKAKKIQSSFNRASKGSYGEDSTTDDESQPRTDPYGTAPDKTPVDETPASKPDDDAEFVDIEAKDIKVVECWKKEYVRVPVLFNPQADFYENGEGVNEQDLQAVVRDIPGFSLSYRKVFRMRIVTIGHDVLLDNNYASPAENDFSLVPYYAKKAGKHVWGKVEGLKYLNREINKLHSKALDILDKQGGYGWFYSEGSFAGEPETKKFLNDKGKAGFAIKVGSMLEKPEKIEGAKLPTELLGLLSLNSEKIKEVANIIPEMQGLNSKSESGVAIAQKKQQGLIGNEFLFDNLRLTTNLLGRKYLQMVPEVYTAEKILRVISNAHSKSPVKVGGTPFDQLTPEDVDAITVILESGDFADYDVSIGESASNPTTRAANFAFALDMIQKMPALGPYVLDLVVNMSDFPEKQEWILRINQVMAAQQQQAQDEAQGSETGKKTEKKAA